MSISFNAPQESLSRTKIQVQVQTDRQVVLVIGYIKSDDFLFLSFLVVFHQREHQTTIFHIVLCLEILLSSINQGLLFYRFAIGKRILSPFLYEVGSNERACNKMLNISNTH